MGNANVKFTQIKTELFIEKVEGFETIAYEDSDSYSICFGNKYYQDDSRVKKGDKRNRRQCLEILNHHIEKRTNLVFKKINISLSENQESAIRSYCYRWGVYGCVKNGLIEAVNNRDYKLVRKLFINQPDAVSRGLKEYELFTTL